MRTRGRLAWVTAAWVLAACYPGVHYTHGAQEGVTMGGDACSGLKQGEWTWPRSDDHCWAFSASRGKELHIQVKSRANDFEATVSVWRRVDEERAQMIDRSRVSGKGTSRVSVDIPSAVGKTVVVQVSDVSGGSYSIKRN